MDELDRESKTLFETARRATDPTPADRARIRAALSAKLGGIVLLASASGKGAATAGAGAAAKGATLLSLTLVKQALPALLVGALIGGATIAVIQSPSKQPAPPSAQTQAPKPKPAQQIAQVAENTAVAPTFSAQVSAPEPPSAPTVAPLSNAVRPKSAAAAAQPSTAASENSALGGELEIITRMQAASRAGDWASVQRAIKLHEERFPNGVLIEEREVMKTIVACQGASRERARELAERFAARHPSSPYAARVSAACKTEKK